MSNNINNGAQNYSISKTPLNNSVFTTINSSKASPMKPSTSSTGSMFSLGRNSANRIRNDGFQETIQNNKYEGAKSSSERIQYLKKIAQGSPKPNISTISYVSNESTNKNDINSAKRRVRNIGYRSLKK